MEFCNNCKNYLSFKEDLIDNKRNLYYYCNKCDYKKKCNINKITFKNYKIKQKLSSDIYLNKYKVNDKTLPKKVSKCKKCNKINNNPYELKYINNLYKMNIICIKCYNNFFI